MRFSFLILFFFCISCSPQLTTINQKKPYYQRQFKEILFEYISEKDKQEVFKRIITEIGVKK